MKTTRSFLPRMGIIIGVASVVIMVSVVQGQNKKNMEYFEKMGNNKITVSAYSYYDRNHETSQKLYDYCLSLSDLVDGITPDVELNDKATVQYGAKTLTVNDYSNGNYDWEKAMHIKLGSDQYGVCNNYTLAGGREMSFLDIEKTNAVCVLGAGAKSALFDYTDPVGETITINGQPFLVVGYYQPMSLDGWPEMDNIIVLPYTFNRTMNQNSTISSYVVKAKSASATTEAMTLLDAYLAGLFPKDEMGNSTQGDYYVQSDNSYAQDIQSQNTMQALVLGAIAGISLPNFWLGLQLMQIFAVNLRILPTGGLESWKGYILPSIAMGAGIMCILARVTRSSMIENLGKDYIRTARAKGLPEHRVIMRHAFKNSSIDVITVTALQIGALIAGSVVVESVFSIPGLGRLLVDSIGFRDYEVVQALILFFSLEYMVINLLADILYGIINPRVRYE